MYLIILEYAILASTFTIAKIALSYAKPFFLIGFRMIMAGSLLLGYQAFRYGNIFSIKRSSLFQFFKVSLFHIYIAFVCEFWALQYLTSAKTAIIYSTTPFFAALLSYLLLGHMLSWRKGGAMLLGLCGLLPMILGNGGEALSVSELLGISLPEIVLLISVVSASYAWFIITDLMKAGYPLALINGWAMLLGGVGSLLTSLAVEGTNGLVYNFWPFLGWTSLLVLMANIISYNLYGWLLRFYSITFMTFCGFLCPIFASLYGWLLLGEAITWHHGVAVVCVTAGLWVYYRDG